MNREECLVKIKKLLAMKRGGTQHEAETAEAMAEIIAAKNGIDLNEVSLDDHGAPRQIVITHRTVGEWGKAPCEATYASLIAKQFFGVSSFTQTGWTDKIIFVGTDWDLDIAAYVFNFLVKEFRWLWNHRRGRCRKRSEFIFGAFIGLKVKLKERFPSPSSSGLIVSMKAKHDAYMKEHFGEMTSEDIKGKGKNSAAANAGFNRGKEIEIRPGIKGSATLPREMLPSSREGRLLAF